MLNAKTFANAVTVVTAVVNGICLALWLVAPALLFGAVQSFTHGLTLESIRTSQTISLGSAVAVFVILAILAWVTSYATIRLYNVWAGARAA